MLISAASATGLSSAATNCRERYLCIWLKSETGRGGGGVAEKTVLLPCCLKNLVLLIPLLRSWLLSLGLNSNVTVRAQRTLSPAVRDRIASTKAAVVATPASSTAAFECPLYRPLRSQINVQKREDSLIYSNLPSEQRTD